jgi:hypothetical protein
LCASPSIIRVINSRATRCAGHVAQIGEVRNAYKIVVKKVKGRDDLEDLGIDGKIILERILGKYGGKDWTGFIWLRIGTSGGFL